MIALLLTIVPHVGAQDLLRGDLLLSEFMADTIQYPAYYAEWFEVYNNSGRTVDLDAILFRHTDDGGASFDELTVSSSLALGAFDYIVFGVSDNTDPGAAGFNGNIPVDYVYDYFSDGRATGFDIAAGGDAFSIVYIDVDNGGAEVVLDEVLWTGAWRVDHDIAHQASYHVRALEWANDWSVNWCSSDQYISVSGLHGSPGGDNAYCAEPGSDEDGDGYTEQEGDCLDSDASVNPEATDGADGTAGDMPDWDDDCDGLRDDGVTDDDGDGYTEQDGDCDDADGLVFPRAPETLDGQDDDCNGCIDDQDADGDAFTDCPEYRDLDGDGREDDPYYDCNNADVTVNPLAEEVPRDGIDNDCDGFDECDVDDDGVESDDPDCLGSDCDDDDPAIRPGALEVPDDGIDNDCDGVGDSPLDSGGADSDPNGDADDTGRDAEDNEEDDDEDDDKEVDDSAGCLGCSSPSQRPSGALALLTGLALLLRRRR